MIKVQRKAKKKTRAVELHEQHEQREAYRLSMLAKYPEPLAYEKYAILERSCPKSTGSIKQKKSKPLLVPLAQAELFYSSSDWFKARTIILDKYGRRCMCCDEADKPVHVDHIKPLRLYWGLRLDLNNLQVLCETCNLLKGNWCSIDFRYSNYQKRKRWLRTSIFYDERLTKYAQQQIQLVNGQFDN